MPRYIDAEKCAQKITALVELEWGYAGIDEDIKEIFNTIPDADVTPVVHAHWKSDCICSNCDFIRQMTRSNNYMVGKFCPNCGENGRRCK